MWGPQVLNVLEYSSARARMSVIVRAPDDSIHLLCKGADAKVRPQPLATRHFAVCLHCWRGPHSSWSPSCGVGSEEIPRQRKPQSLPQGGCRGDSPWARGALRRIPAPFAYKSVHLTILLSPPITPITPGSGIHSDTAVYVV